MLVGIAALSTLTATIAAFLVQEREADTKVTLADVMTELREIRAILGLPPSDRAR